MIKGRLRPKAFSISSTPKAITSESYTTLIVSLLILPRVRVAYSSRDYPLATWPWNTVPLNRASFPDFRIYMDAASSPSLHISLCLSNL